MSTTSLVEIKRKAQIELNKAGSDLKKALMNIFGDDFNVGDIMELIKTFADVLAYKGMTQVEFEAECVNKKPHQIADLKIEYIVEVLNQGWVPNWADGNEGKYSPYFNVIKKNTKSGFGLSYDCCDFTRTATLLGSRRVLKNPELAKYIGTQFIEVYEEALL